MTKAIFYLLKGDYRSWGSIGIQGFMGFRSYKFCTVTYGC